MRIFVGGDRTGREYSWVLGGGRLNLEVRLGGWEGEYSGREEGGEGNIRGDGGRPCARALALAARWTKKGDQDGSDGLGEASAAKKGEKTDRKAAPGPGEVQPRGTASQEQTTRRTMATCLEQPNGESLPQT